MVRRIKRIIRTLSIGRLACAAMAVFLIYSSAGDALISLKPSRSFEDLMTEETAPGDHIEGEVMFMLDYFATEQSWKESSDGSVTPKKTSEYYHLVPGKGIYIGLEVSADDKAAARSIVENLSGDREPSAVSLPFAGKVIKMEAKYPELVSAFREELKNYGFTEQEISDMGEPLLIVRRSFPAIWTSLGLGMVLLLATVFRIGKDIRRAEQRAREKAAAKEAEAARDRQLTDSGKWKW